MPIVHVLESRWGYSQLLQRVPYTMFLFEYSLCYILGPALATISNKYEKSYTNILGSINVEKLKW